MDTEFWWKQLVGNSLWQTACGKQLVGNSLWEIACGKQLVGNSLWETATANTMRELRAILRYTGCNRRNGPDFGRVFLMLNYTETPQNTYIKS